MIVFFVLFLCQYNLGQVFGGHPTTIKKSCQANWSSDPLSFFQYSNIFMPVLGKYQFSDYYKKRRLLTQKATRQQNRIPCTPSHLQQPWSTPLSVTVWSLHLLVKPVKD